MASSLLGAGSLRASTSATGGPGPVSPYPGPPSPDLCVCRQRTRLVL
jgi:hypothetical protein